MIIDAPSEALYPSLANDCLPRRVRVRRNLALSFAKDCF